MLVLNILTIGVMANGVMTYISIEAWRRRMKIKAAASSEAAVSSGNIGGSKPASVGINENIRWHGITHARARNTLMTCLRRRVVFCVCCIVAQATWRLAAKSNGLSALPKRRSACAPARKKKK